MHRLDADTGGLLVCAKTHPAQQALSNAFADRAVKKRYRALVRGALTGCGRVRAPLEGKACWTEYRSVAVTESKLCGHVTTLDLWPHTGRKHQLRQHMAMLGHPILGDTSYWGTGLRHAERGSDGGEGVMPSGEQGHERIEEADLIDAPQAQPGASCAHASGEGQEKVDDVSHPLIGVHVLSTGISESEQTPDADGPGANGALADASDHRWRQTQAGVMCLWALQCRLTHPHTGEPLDVCIPEPAVFESVRAAHVGPSTLPGAARGNQA